MTLAKTARILIDPKAVLQTKEGHDLAHVIVKAVRKVEFGGRNKVVLNKRKT